MSFHNVRDKYGRFAKKTASTTRKRTKKSKPAVSTESKIILNGFLFDASGSMSGKETSVVNGFNEIIIQGKKDEIATGVVNKQFAAFFGTGYTQAESEIHRLIFRYGICGTTTPEGVTYSATMGNTALWYSTYKLIVKLTDELLRFPNAKVILTIFTDGGENQSPYEWSDGTKIKAIIEQKQKEGWVINFIGAGSKEAVEKVATSVGIFASNTLSYANNSAGTARAMAKMSASRSTYTASVASGADTNVGFFSND